MERRCEGRIQSVSCGDSNSFAEGLLVEKKEDKVMTSFPFELLLSGFFSRCITGKTECKLR